MIQRALRYLRRPELRRRPVLLLSRRLRYELLRRGGAGALRRDRTIRFDGDGRLRVRLDDSVERAVYLYGVYEFLAAEVFKTLVREGSVVVDAGAHVGQYTVLAAKRVGPRGRVLSFEPDPGNRARLLENIRLNGAEHVTVLPLGLARTETTLALRAAEPGNSGTAALSRDPADGIPVRCVRLDDAVREQGIERVDVLKLDVEGFEADVLAGARATIERSPPAILFEVNDDAVLDDLRGLGYRLYGIAGNDGARGWRLVELAPGADPGPLAERWHALNLLALHERSPVALLD